MNLPNLLTSLRIVAIPVLVIVLFTQFEGKELVAFIIFLVAALTDMFDGFLARRREEITILGQILDPIADKLLVASAFICLVELGAVQAWMVVIILGREIAITGFRAIASSKRIYIPSSRLGKIKMIFVNRYQAYLSRSQPERESRFFSGFHLKCLLFKNGICPDPSTAILIHFCGLRIEMRTIRLKNIVNFKKCL